MQEVRRPIGRSIAAHHAASAESTLFLLINPAAHSIGCRGMVQEQVVISAQHLCVNNACSTGGLVVTKLRAVPVGQPET